MGSRKQCLEASKTKDLTKAKDALKTYLQKHSLDPKKNWMIDKVHGKRVTELVRKLNLERDKVMARYPYTDAKHERRRMNFHHKTKLKFQELMATKAEKKKAEKAKAAKKAAEKESKAVAQAPVENLVPKKEKKEKPTNEAKAPRTLKYEYPLIDGREMTAAEKKQYRIKMRKEAAGGTDKPAAKKEKPVKPVKEEAKPSKKEKPSKEASAEKTEKKVKKVKKAKKVED